MARFKDYSYEQQLLIPVSLSRQILPGTFEYTLNQLISEELDLSIFCEKYKNDITGAPAYDPAILLKIILFAYSKGINSSRKIEEFCRENIVCIALTADAHPHFTTIADFISSMDKECIALFTKILSICYSENLIGKNMFAIDGCKISSNCSKEWSGTKKELLKKSEKIKAAMEYLVSKHKKSDSSLVEDNQIKTEKESIQKLKKKADKITSWLETHDEKLGASNQPKKSNIIDNESAKMSSSHGVIQGYNGIAAVDGKHQLIIWAEAYGDIHESGHLPEILNGIDNNCITSGIDKKILNKVIITADSGFHNAENMQLVCEKHIDAYIPDNRFRQRDIRFSDAKKYKKQIAKWQPDGKSKHYTSRDFHLDTISGDLICPAGKAMRLKVKNYKNKQTGCTGRLYAGKTKNCKSCSLREKCLRNPGTTIFRQVALLDKNSSTGNKYSNIMKDKFDTPYARSIYSKRMGTVEPVFGHIAGTKKLNRFTLRSKKKVNNQWLLYCIVHNIGKIQKYGT